MDLTRETLQEIRDAANERLDDEDDEDLALEWRELARTVNAIDAYLARAQSEEILEMHVVERPVDIKCPACKAKGSILSTCPPHLFFQCGCGNLIKVKDLLLTAERS